MPKLKSNKSASKRFKKLGGGGFKHRQSFRSHILTKKPSKRTRQLRGLKTVNDSDFARVNQMLPNG